MSKHWGIWVGLGWVEMGGKEVEEWVGCVGYMGGVGTVNGYYTM